jgi:hypothetical protein
MTPCHFRGQDRVLEAPRDLDPETCPVGEIVGLPVRFLRDDQGNLMGFRSVWRPSAEQLEALNAGGGVMVDLLTQRQPPMLCHVCPPEDVLVEA